MNEINPQIFKARLTSGDQKSFFKGWGVLIYLNSLLKGPGSLMR